MENAFQWYPTPIDLGVFALIALFIILMVTLFIVSRKQKPEESTPPHDS